jgi:glutamate-1-semialdehyde aminotransferase
MAIEHIMNKSIAYPCHNIPRQMPANVLRSCWVCIENRGSSIWQGDLPEGGSAGLAIYLDGVFCTLVELPKSELGPGERLSIHWQFRAPGVIGSHQLRIVPTDREKIPDNIAAKLKKGLRTPYRRIANFLATHLNLILPAFQKSARTLNRLILARAKTSDQIVEQPGAKPLIVTFEVTDEVPTSSSRLMDQAEETCWWSYFPTQGISWSRDGRHYPLFAKEARGCRITDLEGRHYIDYLMGFGCALLGYAHEGVQRAVSEALDSAAVVSLPHYLEMDVISLLCEMIPCSERVLFGKNGSDVCTAAVRLARAHTGRSLILVCGYHGWQDWYVETKGFFWTGVPERRSPLVVHFPFNNRNAFLKLIRKHRGEVAAVMLEPAGPIQPQDLTDPVLDADPDYLTEVAAVTRHEGALLIFDEIITGFRYPGGSVQKATGVIPDLACFGKALSGGMPLSALVGRREVFASGGRIGYGPTFNGEVYSFAAAKAALRVYKEQDVAGHVWSHGNRLKEAVNQICRRLGVPAEMTGPPFRMLLIFHEADELRRLLMRTFVQQELLRRGILTLHGVFIVPSYAHDDEAFTETLSAFEQVLSLLTKVGANDTYANHLEIPPVSGY